MFKRSWVSLGLLALLGGFFTVATMPVSPAQASACFSTFTNKTVSNGLGSSYLAGVYVVGSTVYAATLGVLGALGGLGISTDSGANFTNKTTADGLGSNIVLGVYVVGSNVYAATASGLSISTNCGPSALVLVLVLVLILVFQGFSSPSQDPLVGVRLNPPSITVLTVSPSPPPTSSP